MGIPTRSASLTFMFMLVLLLSGQALALNPNYYATSCKNLQAVVKQAVETAVKAEQRMAASLLRLHFHDCFVNGCDGSVLLDDTATLTGEKNAVPNKNSLRGFNVVDNIKAEVEKACPKTVSCADILAIAARDSVVLSGGPTWTVQLGRRDSTTASQSAANSGIPKPSSSVTDLVSLFNAVGLNELDMITLSGAHTIGDARCAAITGRLYPTAETDISAAYLTQLEKTCPNGGNAQAVTSLDAGTPTRFDNSYYKNLLLQKGTLHSDQVLYSTQGSNVGNVNTFATNQATFFSNFQTSMVKMGNISPLTGTQGQVRTNCRVVN